MNSWKTHRPLEASCFLIVFGLYLTSAHDKVLQGVTEQCRHEGEPVAVDHIANSGCFSCVCRNGFVECRNDYNCPSIEGCFMLAAKTEDGCCKKCKGCYYKGIYRQSNTEWSDYEDPCRVYRCEAGVVTESDLQCHMPCADPLPPEPGKCCPTCPECNVNGQIATDDRYVISDDPCLKCQCSRGRMICSKKACPVLQCSKSWQHFVPGECCPKCVGTRALMMVAKSCTLQNSFVREGQSFNIDRCTNCSCVNETSICTRKACPILDCAPDLQKSDGPGSCCKKCIMPEEIRSQCFYGETLYEEGQSWRMDACRSCKCHKGMPSCAMTRCNVTLPCGPGMKLVKTPGECCEKCQEVDGVCMVFGDPHYKTFDGKIYTFHGVGRYHLVSDCENHTFSIRVANTPSVTLSNWARNKLVRTTTKRVAIKYGSIRLNLQHRTRIKFNGRLIRTPFKRDGKVRIDRVKNNTEVKLHNGIKIVWSGKSFLEVSIPASLKNKVCGLCGNFNSIVQDDFTMKTGRIAKDNEVHLFGASWCAGSKINCTKQGRQTAKILSCSVPRPHQNYCKYLSNGHIFGNCHSLINYSKYYKPCKMDMCNCGNERCYCDSLMAYARECERLGVHLPNWQDMTSCYTEHSKRPKKYKRKHFSTAEIAEFKHQMMRHNTTRHSLLHELPIH